MLQQVAGSIVEHEAAPRRVYRSPLTVQFSVMDVAKVEVKAESNWIESTGKTSYRQELVFLDGEGEVLGSVLLFLTGPEVALPCGEMPPYFGAEEARPDPLTGESPF
jgi:hypothetical protein